MEETTKLTPPGWYPDPSGQAQWRVWTGSQWSTLTRPYNSSPPSTPRIVASLTRVQAIARVRYLATLGYFGGLNLLASLFRDWPKGSHPFSDFWLLPLLGLAGSLLILAWVVSAQAIRTFQDNWTFWALLPFGNLLMVMGLIRKDLFGPLARSNSGDLVGLAMWLFVASSSPISGIITALIAAGQIQLTSVYLNNVTLG